MDNDEMVKLQAPAPAPTPPAVTPQPAAAAPIAPAPARTAGTSELAIPLLPILEKLPADLRAKWVTGGVNLGQATICIAVEKVLPQLALGAVKISFGELRQAAPDVFRSGEEHDSLPVALPLNEVLSRLNPALIARNPAQKAVMTPPEISEPFGPGAQGVTITTPPPKPTPATTHFFKKPAPPAEPIKMPEPQPVATPPLTFGQRATTPLPSAPAAPVTPRMNPLPQILATPPPAMLHRAPIPFMAPAAPTAKPEAPRPASAPITPVTPEVSAIMAPLAALAENWPEALRREIAQLNLSGAKVALPAHLIEPALKRGRVIISWHHLRSWIRPAPPGVSVHDEMELELPLKVLAPLFVPKQPAALRPQTKAPLPPASVPNLFFGFPKPQPEAAPPLPSLPANGEAVPAAPAVKPVDQKLAETNYYVWGDNSDKLRMDETDYKRPPTPATDFSSRRAMPSEIIEMAMKLPGVAGAIVALPDGLKVAFQLPPDLNADTVAGFLPQLFSRVSLCSKELRMGELNNLNFTLGNTPWKIFRVNAVYFAAFGRAGEPLPTAQLAALAAELDRRK